MHLLTGFVTVTSNEFFFSTSVFENSFPAFSAVKISVASKTDMSPIAHIPIYEKAEVNFQTRSSYFGCPGAEQPLFYNCKEGDGPTGNRLPFANGHPLRTQGNG